MKLSVTRVILLMALPLSLSIISCQKKLKGDDVIGVGAPSPVELRFKGVYDKFSDLDFNSTYALGLTFIKFKTLKYYVSNIEFVNTDGDTISVPDTYFLIDHSKPELTRAVFTAPAGEYYAMSFLLGVDATRSANGPRTGALDPALGMFWNPSDGYVHAMIEGITAPSSDPDDEFSFRVGGYAPPYNTLSRRDFKLGGTVTVTPNRKTIINFDTDAIQWFTGPNPVPFATMPFIDGPGPESQKLSQNYYKMFTFISVKYE